MLKKIFAFYLINILLFSFDCAAQNVGIGTTTPSARLHVTDSAVLFTGPVSVPTTTDFPPPASDRGSRMMWYPQKGAFRVGGVFDFNWNKDNIGRYSFASGFDSKANGEYSIAMGNSTASGSYSTAMGKSTASGAYSFASGFESEASGYNSVAMGNSTASGSYSTAIESGTASGFYSTAMGNSVASGSYSTAMGIFTKSKSIGGTVLGLYNDSTNAADPLAINSANRIFQIGNGTADNARSNAMTVLQNGKIGIGNVNPTIGVLEVNSSTSAPQVVVFQRSTTDYSRITFRNGSSAAANRFWDLAGTTDPTAASNDKFNIYNNTVGDILSIRGNGNAILMGTLTQSSDARLKTNIQPLKSSIQNIRQLNGYTYNWKENNRDKEKQIGVLAQEVQKIYPELVNQDEKGVLSVNYIGLVPVLIEGIKEQQKQIEEQTKELQEQNHRNKLLQTANEELRLRLEKLEEIVLKTQ